MLRTRAIGLGLDAGGSATRWVLLSGEQIINRGEVGPISGHLLLTGSHNAVAAEISRVADAITTHPQPTHIFAGVTGTSAGSTSSRAIEAMLAYKFSLEEDAVRVTTDLWITYHACFRPGEGIVVYSGTGSAAIHITSDRREVVVGGLGYLIDDAGSGFWIGQMAVRSVLRLEEAMLSSGWSSPLGQRIASRVGEGSWSALRAYVYGGDRSRLALLGPAVGDAAKLDEDPLARRILLEAGRELGRLFLVMTERVGRLPLKLTGGAGTLPFVAEGLSQVVGERVDGTRPDAALAAARLSLALAPVA